MDLPWSLIGGGRSSTHCDLVDVMPSSVRICIVTSTHISANPRVVKEADALAAAGHAVHVVFAQFVGAAADQYDSDLLSDKAWTWSAVRLHGGQAADSRWRRTTGRHGFARLSPSALWPYSLLAEDAQSLLYRDLAHAADIAEGDLYIGHYPTGLAAAASAATSRKALLGFDAEDFHTGEGNSAKEIARVDFIQRRYLPQCSFVTAASAGIAQALSQRYSVSAPVAVYNTFPWHDRESLDHCMKDRRGDSLSLYWYSQTVGLDRGIQDAISAAGHLEGKIQLHIRGTITPAIRGELESRARKSGVAGLYFHPQVAPRSLLSRAAEHDVGLALEQGTVMNRRICTTNKLFLYFLAGLAVAATDVPGQALVMRDAPDAGTVYTPGDSLALATALDRWRSDPAALRKAKQASLQAARQRWNWESERAKLIDLVQQTIERRSTSSRVPRRLEIATP